MVVIVEGLQPLAITILECQCMPTLDSPLCASRCDMLLVLLEANSQNESMWLTLTPKLQ